MGYQGTNRKQRSYNTTTLQNNMKTAFFLVLSVLLWAGSAMADDHDDHDDHDPVLDIAGQQLRTGVDYYILPVVRGRGGGLTLASTGNETCPLDVVQEQQEVDPGFPATFSPVNVANGVVRESTDLNIKFSAASTCVQTTLWSLKRDESVQRWVVSTGGAEGNPGRETISNWFKIEEDDDDYKLVYCPTVCDTCRPVCGDLGIFIDNDGIRRLVISDEPLKVMFRRA